MLPCLWCGSDLPFVQMVKLMVKTSKHVLEAYSFCCMIRHKSTVCANTDFLASPLLLCELLMR